MIFSVYLILLFCGCYLNWCLSVVCGFVVLFMLSVSFCGILTGVCFIVYLIAKTVFVLLDLIDCLLDCLLLGYEIGGVFVTY